MNLEQEIKNLSDLFCLQLENLENDGISIKELVKVQCDLFEISTGKQPQKATLDADHPLIKTIQEQNTLITNLANKFSEVNAYTCNIKLMKALEQHPNQLGRHYVLRMTEELSARR